MPFYKAVFRLPGGKELEADKGYVPDAFFDAIQKVTTDAIVYIFEGGFVWSNEIHEKLHIHGAFTSYAIIGEEAPEGAETTGEFANGLLKLLKKANHARPIREHYNYQVFYMEDVEPDPEEY